MNFGNGVEIWKRNDIKYLLVNIMHQKILLAFGKNQ